MSTFDDDDIEFDFFDEPETQEAAQRRRLPRLELPQRGPRGGGGGRPPRGPVRPGPGLAPLSRLIGLVAALIFIVVVLVLWTQSCQGASKQSAYQQYMEHVRVVAQQSDTIGQKLQDDLAKPGIKAPALASSVDELAQAQREDVDQAQTIKPPGPLRVEHAHLVDSLALRRTGLTRFADALRQTAGTKNASQAAALLAQQAQLLVASDVVWDFFFHDPTVQELKAQGVTGVAVPDSSFLPNADLVSLQSLVRIVGGFKGASTGGTPSGKHGDGVISVKALPEGLTLSTSQPTTVTASTKLAFQVTVENSGCCTEVGVPVTLTIEANPPIVKRKTIQSIAANTQQTVTFTDIGQPPFGAQTKVKAVVSRVPGEKNLSNNSATYPVFFSIGGG